MASAIEHEGSGVVADPLVGRVLAGRYRITALIGSGGMGTVYLAEHLTLRRAVAIKMLGPRLAGDALASERFMREVEVISQLRHPHIVDVHDFDIDDGNPFLVMELLEGETLEDLLDRQESLPIEETVRVAAGIAAGLAAAHRAGVVHRDLKPSNVFLVDAGSEPTLVKLLDFGISKQLGSSRRKITGEYDLVGTAHYMAPEQATSSNVGPAADQYALGVTVFEMLSGTLPFEADHPLDVVRAALQGSPPPLSERCPGYGTALDAVIARALAKVPAHRFSEVTKFVAELWAAARQACWADAARPPAASGTRPTSPRSAGHASQAYSRWPVDPVRSVMAALDEVLAARSAGSLDAALPPALDALALADKGDSEVRAALTLAAPLLEDVLLAALDGADARLRLARLPSPADEGVSAELAYVASRIEGVATVGDVLDTSPLPRLDTLKALVVLSRRGIVTREH